MPRTNSNASRHSPCLATAFLVARARSREARRFRESSGTPTRLGLPPGRPAMAVDSTAIAGDSMTTPSSGIEGELSLTISPYAYIEWRGPRARLETLDLVPAHVKWPERIDYARWPGDGSEYTL